MSKGKTYRCILVIGSMIILAIGVTGCNKISDNNYNNTSMIKMSNGTIIEYVDPDTGVHYIKSNSSSSGFTPRLNSDGTVMVDK